MRAQYEQFAARRRALLEAEGERVAAAALEKAARGLNPGRVKDTLRPAHYTDNRGAMDERK